MLIRIQGQQNLVLPPITFEYLNNGPEKAIVTISCLMPRANSEIREDLLNRQ